MDTRTRCVFRFGRKPPDALADGRGDDAAALVVHVVARHLQPARRRGEHEGAVGRHGANGAVASVSPSGAVVGVPTAFPPTPSSAATTGNASVNRSRKCANLCSASAPHISALPHSSPSSFSLFTRRS